MKIQIIILFLCSAIFSSALGDLIKSNAGPNLSHADHADLLSYFVLGQPTNDISAGILKESSQSNAVVCLLGVGQVKARQLYVAPPQLQRVEYFLYDASHEPIPYSESYNPPNKIYKTMADVPKNVHNVHEGMVWGPPFPMPYDQIVLTNLFRIKNDGDYKLVIKARIMKVNHDSTLSLMEFPPVYLTIHISL